MVVKRMESFGDMLKKDREKIGLSQEALAKLLDVSQQAVANWENGTSHPRKDRRTRLLQILGQASLLATVGPRYDFFPAKDQEPPRPGLEHVAVLGEGNPVSDRARLSAAMASIKDIEAQMELQKTELAAGLGTAYLAHLDGKVQVGAALRRLTYLSPKVGAEIKRLGAERFMSSIRYSVPILSLAVVKGITATTHPDRRYFLIVVADDIAATLQRGLQRVMFDAGVLGITVQVVNTFEQAGELIRQIEEEPPEELQARVEVTEAPDKLKAEARIGRPRVTVTAIKVTVTDDAGNVIYESETPVDQDAEAPPEDKPG